MNTLYVWVSYIQIDGAAFYLTLPKPTRTLLLVDCVKVRRYVYLASQ